MKTVDVAPRTRAAEVEGEDPDHDKVEEAEDHANGKPAMKANRSQVVTA